MDKPLQERRVLVIGMGGIGGWLLPALDKTLPVDTAVMLYDKDKIEERNLDRQLFKKIDIGRNKARQAAGKVTRLTGVGYTDAWFTDTTEIPENTTVFCCADNHRARYYAWLAVNRTPGCNLIVGANEYTDAEAYFYTPQFKGTPADMLQFYPDIATDKSGAPTEHCTGVVQESHPQLAISNMLAASYMMWLHWFWNVEKVKLGDQFPIEETPVRVSGNYSRIRTKLYKEFGT